MLRRLCVAAGVALATATSVVPAGPASADPPQVIERHTHVLREFPGLTDCQQFGYDFTYTGTFQVDRTVTDFYDRDGTLIREVVHIVFTGTSTNDDTGTSLPTNGSRHLVFDYVDNTFTETGVLRHVTVPGSGIVLHQSGRLVLPFDSETPLFEAGPHQEAAGDLAAFCAALAA